MVTFFVTSAVMVLLVLLVRFLFRNKVSFLILYPLWGMVLLRFLVPVTPIESPASIMNMAEKAVSTGNALVSGWKGMIREQRETKAFDAFEDLEEIELHPPVSVPKQFPKEQKEEIRTEKTYSGKERKRKINPAGLIYFCISIGLLACIIGSNALFYRRLRKERKRVRYLNCHGLFGREIPVYVTSFVPSPCIAGVFHPVIYLPRDIYDTGNLKQILAHEQMHDRHGDPVWALLRTICCVVYWFDPFVWFAAFYSKQDAEIACDEAVMRDCTDEERYCYGLMLIEMSKKDRQKYVFFMKSITSMENGKRNLKERIIMLTKKRKHGRLQIIGMLAIMAVLAGCGLTGSAQSQSGQQKDAAINENKNDNGSGNGGSSKKEEAMELEEPESPVIDQGMILQEFQDFMADEIKKRTEWKTIEEWNKKTEELYFSVQYLTPAEIPCLLIAPASLSPSPVIMENKAKTAMVYYYNQKKGSVELLTVLRTIGSGYALRIKDGQFVVDSDQHAIRVYDLDTEGNHVKLTAKEVYGYGTYDDEKGRTVYTCSEFTWQAPLPVAEGASPYDEDIDSYAEAVDREEDYNESEAEEFLENYQYGQGEEILFSKNTKKTWKNLLKKYKIH